MKETTPTPSSEENAALGRLMRQCREAAQINVRDMARAVGVSLNTYRWHEGGALMLRLDKVIMASRVLGLPLSAVTQLPEPAKKRKKTA